MTADLLIRDISQIVTPPHTGPIRGRAMRELSIIPHAAIAIANGRILWCGPANDWAGNPLQTVSAGNRAVVPALIDPHTHAVWGGDRLNDFQARTEGVPYEEILKRGGGIRSTITATASAHPQQLIDLALPRIHALVRSGAATIEIKSGYGFSLDAELRILRAIRALSKLTPATLIPTLLIHVPPVCLDERDPYIAEVCESLIPAVAGERLATFIDVFVERESWTAEEARGMIRLAREYGIGARLHTEQFHRVGGLEMGLEENVASVDHLEAAFPGHHHALGLSNTVATILPGVSLHLGCPSAAGRALIEAGAIVALGTDLNPGSSPLFSTSAAMALAVRMNGLLPAEALTASTANAAASLHLTDRGAIAPGLRADLVVIDSPDWRDLPYTLGANVVHQVWIAGKPVAA